MNKKSSVTEKLKFESTDIPEPTITDCIVKIQVLSDEVRTTIEAIKALGREVIDSNVNVSSALTDLALKMGDLQSAFIRTVQAPTNSLPVQTGAKSQFDPEDLMKHQWKGKKIGDKRYEKASDNYGWDFKDQFKDATLGALEKGPVMIDQYVFTLKRRIVGMQKEKKQ